MNNSEKTDDKLIDVASLEEIAQQPTGELLEVETAELEQVAGGGNGTVLGYD